MSQHEIIKIMKTKPNKWWYSKEVEQKLGEKLWTSFKQLVKYGFVERKEIKKPRTAGIYYMYKLKVKE